MIEQAAKNGFKKAQNLLAEASLKNYGKSEYEYMIERMKALFDEGQCALAKPSHDNLKNSY